MVQSSQGDNAKLAERIELLPCPFCGSKNIDSAGWATLPEYAKTPEERHGPACDDCGASAETIEIWNKRALLAALPFPQAAGVGEELLAVVAGETPTKTPEQIGRALRDFRADIASLRSRDRSHGEDKLLRAMMFYEENFSALACHYLAALTPLPAGGLTDEERETVEWARARYSPSFAPSGYRLIAIIDRLIKSQGRDDATTTDTERS